MLLIVFLFSFSVSFSDEKQTQELILNKEIEVNHSFENTNDWWKNNYQEVLRDLGLNTIKENELLKCNTNNWNFILKEEFLLKDNIFEHNIQFIKSESGNLLDQKANIKIIKNKDITVFKLYLYIKINRIMPNKALNFFSELCYAKFRKKVINLQKD